MPNLKPIAFAAAGLSLAFAALQPAIVLAATTAPAAAAPQSSAEQADRRRVQEGSGSRTRGRAPAAPSPEEIKTKAQELVTAAGATCQVSEAALLGTAPDGASYYEVGCAVAPGFIVASTTPPAALNCFELISSARNAREADPAADVGTECKMPANMAMLPVVTGYAQSAGVPCAIDDAIATGKTETGLVFEVGCAGAQGYRLENEAGAWKKIDCLQLTSAGATCKFTTPEEISASVKGWLAGSDAAACDPTQTRVMGTNTRGTFYEVKCTGDVGYVFLTNAEQAVQQVYACADAAHIGGGCTLTTVAAAPPAAAPTTEQ